MSTTRGCFGVVQVDGNAVAETRSWEFTENAERIDTSVMGDCTKKYVAGPVETTGRFSTWMDDSDTDGQGAIVTGSDVTLTLYPDGVGSGKPARTGTVTITSLSESATVDGVVERNYEYAVSGVFNRTPQT